MTRDETLAMYTANCRCCLLAPAMRDCNRCLFNVGLSAVLDLTKKIVAMPLFMGRAYDKPEEQPSDYLKLLRALHADPDPADIVDFTDEHEAADRAREAVEREARQGPFWMDDNCGTVSELAPHQQAALMFGDCDLSLPNTEFGSAAWFAGIPEEEL